MHTATTFASADKKTGVIHVSLWSGPVHCSGDLSVEAAEDLIERIRKAIDSLPVEAAASDFAMVA
ncbi:hypothetical protein UFOVP833_27 [uncultured Caudovirales phage]|uniref:Uncharacterized protein n=1 Tax=uncultured Caudovirales phage TaxID=2100421 RepID=A0A6J5SW70_9CAUD|nr:hypothetical protein UFOVP833_27 [uncultured Caudovirales phage]CAB4218881.1 hypothetical protein UFOVP1603_60 [uncultured Caudovirales phage]